MIVVLCDSFNDAKMAFYIFLDFLQESEPQEIRNIFVHSYCVETNYDLRYIFVDYRFKPIFEDMKPDFIGVDEFFEDMDAVYNWKEETYMYM